MHDENTDIYTGLGSWAHAAREAVSEAEEPVVEALGRIFVRSDTLGRWQGTFGRIAEEAGVPRWRVGQVVRKLEQATLLRREDAGPGGQVYTPLRVATAIDGPLWGMRYGVALNDPNDSLHNLSGIGVYRLRDDKFVYQWPILLTVRLRGGPLHDHLHPQGDYAGYISFFTSGFTLPNNPGSYERAEDGHFNWLDPLPSDVDTDALEREIHAWLACEEEA